MREMMLDKITDYEYNLMEQYRNRYAWQEEVGTSGTIPIRDLLSIEWAKSKQNLFSLFGNNLMLTKEFHCEKSLDELEGEICQMVDSCTYGRSERVASTFYHNYRNWISSAFPVNYGGYYWETPTLTPEEEEENERNSKLQHCLSLLGSVSALAENEYTHESFTIPLRDGRSYTVHTGCKPMKALAKIATSYGIEGFEDFRICHSQVHNQKKIKGELTISIHPLDYWTMSDNTCGWDSCMSWMNNGGYRTGTVEMMNSPMVVVAYIAAKDNMSFGKGNEWNSKKWRQLFVVSKDVILGIKDYPYHNENISDCVACWLRDLAKENMGWTYTSENPFNWNKQNSFAHPEKEDTVFSIHFSTNRMYNDTGSNLYTPIFVGAETKPSEGNLHLSINYSGLNQCVSCGVTSRYDCVGADDSCVCCTDCEDLCCCPECGERIYEDDRYYYNGRYYCSDCYWDFMSRCDVCEEDMLSDDVSCMTFFVRGNKKIIEGEVNKVLNIYYEKYVCDTCLKTFNEDYLKPGCSYFKYENSWGGNQLGIFVEDLNSEGEFLLNWRTRETLTNALHTKVDLDVAMASMGDFVELCITDYKCGDAETD